MGGNALSVPTRRYEKNEYLSILNEIKYKLNSLGIVCDTPAWYADKDSFGDLDLMIKSSTLSTDINKIINNLFKPNEVYNNNSVISFDYKEFQIDFILVSDENWITSLNYYSYNDLGNFIGRISYKMGFRFGHYGLKLVYRHDDGGKKFSKILSKDPEKIYKFLGFDYQRYLKGFDKLEDIFEFVVSSKNFNKSIFDYDQLNHQNRTRNKKRKNYELFLDYVKNLDSKDYEFKSKDYYVTKAENYFNVELVSQIKSWNDIIETQKKASGIFNGNVVMEKYSLRGKELGSAMKNFNEYFDSLLPDASNDEKKLYRSRWILDNNLNVIFELFEKINNIK